MAKITFTAGRVAGFKCPADKAQAFLWDVTAPGLGLRATPAGKPSYVFQSEFQGKTIRLTIGSPDAWSIPQAQDKARELQRLIDGGHDPRDLKRDALAATEAKKAAIEAARAAAAVQAATVGEVWTAYLAERRPHWGERHYADHLTLSSNGGEKPKNRRKGLTKPGPLAALMPLPLRDLTAPAIEAWAAREGKTRPTRARLAWRCLKAFLNWCAEQPEYAQVLPSVNPAKTKKAREALGKPGVKQDALMKEQLSAWFEAVGNLPSATVSAYLKTVLLTGARPGEVLAMRWEDINLQWRGLTIRDKVEGLRVVPLTPYVSHLLAALPRRNEWVFSSPRTNSHMTRLDPMHSAACAVAGIEGLTLHGLRRSFKSLTEWLEIPAGVVAQIMGHKPSATAEKHYTVRPLDLLRLHHEKIEAWILEQAGVSFVAKAEPGKLALVSAAA
jgi:integrase